MRQARLDATDWRILRELQADGRITNVELARKVGISAPPCLRRVRALEEAGIIKGFTALLNDKALGFDVTAFAMIRLHSQAEADLIAFEERAVAFFSERVERCAKGSPERALYEELAAEEREHVALLSTELARWRQGKPGLLGVPGVAG